MSKNNNLHTAKATKNDEFYTQYADIQKELGIAQDFETTVIVPVGKIAKEPAKEDRTSRYQVTIY